MVRRLLIPSVVLLCCTTTVLGATPSVIIIEGEHLPQRVVLSDWDQNQQFMAGFVENDIVKSEELAGRPYLELSLFWGPEWQNYVTARHSLSELRSEHGNQHGRLYLAASTAEPAISLNGLYARKLNDYGVSVLTKHGVPVRHATSRLPLLLIVSLCLVGLVLLFIRHRHKSRFTGLQDST